LESIEMKRMKTNATKARFQLVNISKEYASYCFLVNLENATSLSLHNIFDFFDKSCEVFQMWL